MTDSWLKATTYTETQHLPTQPPGIAMLARPMLTPSVEMYLVPLQNTPPLLQPMYFFLSWLVHSGLLFISSPHFLWRLWPWAPPED